MLPDVTRTAVVTGATGGIGTAIVRALAARGDRVLAVGRSAVKLAALASPQVVPVVLDLTDPIELPRPLTELERLDALVHCAGIAEVASVEESPPTLWQNTFAVNVMAPAELTRGMLPALRAANGSVVFINIADGMHAVANWSAYVASKAALKEFAGSLRAEERLRVTSIYPSGVDTELLQEVRAKFGRPYDPDACVRPETLASLVITALDCPADAQVTELTVRPAPA
ncbi:NADP-dependent 3-hydroxy acid dehydrogenase YdfG [Kibdelosporangium aridum]|uniref:NADP-dependent 3-hydroxy acid dehydrogenase YdfG n=1 Tax=Kibdelosporangium aridum TaxID=2030 RepID=A0A1Y5X2F3_KIBAR|nr:NADP-dependent 3-hydroxy acid dehydrogenase YdfG [Kibdelosporangium aridum]